MIRTVCVVLVALAVCGCSKESEEDNVPAPSARASSAQLTFRNQTWDLHVTGDCGPAEDGSFRTWAVTLDDNGEPVPAAPHLVALSSGDWAVIDFFTGEGDEVKRIYREGEEKFAFSDGVLEFAGELGAGLTEEAEVKIVCP